MKILSTILYVSLLCILFVFMVRYGRTGPPEGMALVPAADGTDPFYMDIYEVTNADYQQFIDANPQWQKDKALTSVVGDDYLSLWNGNIYPKRQANHPVVKVSWFAAKAYAEWVGKELPTQAQWEKASRGGLTGKIYPWGDARPNNRANYDRYTDITDFKHPPTKEVGSYLPNEYGLYDMAGNVEEWCRDRLDVNDIHGRYHRIRGGSWFDSTEDIRISRRSQHPVDDGIATLGFRCVLPSTEQKSTKVATDIASWLHDEMQNQFDSARYSVSESFTAHADFDTKLDEIVLNNTGYPRTFERELISVLQEVKAERMASDHSSKNIPFEASSVNRDMILRMWRLYLEIHFEHGDKSVFEKLGLFKESVRENINAITMQNGR